MVNYSVYRAAFKTKKGTKRRYVGYSGFPLRRKRQLQQKGGEFQPAYLKAGCEDFDFQIIADGITNKGTAMAVEALQAALHWKTFPNTRGGPWLRPTLLDSELTELRSAARCETLADLFHVASDYPDGKLNAHLRNLDYKPTSCCQAAKGQKQTSQASSSGVKPKHAASASGVKLKRAVAKPRDAPCLEPKPAAVKPRGVPRDWRYVVVKRKGAKWSGHKQRLSLSLNYGDSKYTKHKWGNKPVETQNKHQRTYRAKRATSGKTMKAMKATRAMKARKA